MLNRADVEEAAARISGHVRRTPVAVLEPEDAGVAVGPSLFKLEMLQHSGSFKARGAFNRLLAAREAGALPEAGVIAASGGNHGLAVGHAAARLGIQAEIFVPTTAPPVKLAALKATGAVVGLHGAEYAEAYGAAKERAAATGALFCHAYDQPEVCAGQGTTALELLEQAGPDGLDTVLVAVGGGGLLAGIAAAVDGRARVVAVEPEAIPTLHRALAAGGPVDVPVSGIAADALGARRLGGLAHETAVRHGVRSVLVPDAEIASARRALWERRRLLVEPAGAAALAALRCGAYRPEPGERVGVVLCGANTDPSDLGSGLG
ncbi:threonine/serine dehydratase [Peterkaempfera bronchialis]|uniref:threonine ammonia-lyase n=1 Tax=Peterkaempfera bronchialis TaxID=2126346 RepID=A0A345ST53_9ACTN|nr:threonine/serine dehydratase [Peterkaempfera bronchialis]AXI76908.1 threonine/serine dehydratase [Peterkaempfera bronchialis]